MIQDWIEHPPPANEKLKAAIAALAENQQPLGGEAR
jgi:hypothetical protein